jgi:MYXO-CTERM domain-containing protein
MIGGKCADGGVIYLNSSGGGAGVRDVDDNKSDTVSSGDRSDSYDCSEILESSRGNWHHFCHINIAGGELAVKCYPHDDPSTPWDQVTMSKGVVENDGGMPGPDGGVDAGSGSDSKPDADAGVDAGVSQDPDEDKQPDPVGCQCSEDLQPVCGSDGQTYQNRCQLSCSGVAFVHEGECVVMGCGCGTGASSGALLVLVLVPLFLTRRRWLVILKHGDNS